MNQITEILTSTPTMEVRDVYRKVLLAMDTPNARARATRARAAGRALADLLGDSYDPHRDLAAYARELDPFAWPEVAAGDEHPAARYR